MSITERNEPLVSIKHSVPRDGGHLSVTEYEGMGPTFVLMHGFPDNQQIYGELVPYLVKAGRRVVTFDFLGFGSSSKGGDTSYSFKQQLEDLVAVVDTLRLDKIIPVAHDASGPSVINYAIEHPGKVHSVCLLNTLYGATPAAARLPELIELFANPGLSVLAGEMIQSPEQIGFLLNFQFGKFQESLAPAHRAHSGEFLGPIVVNSFTQQPSSANAFVQMAADLYAEIGRNTARIAELESLDIPVKIIWGGNDPYLKVGMAEDFNDRLKDSVLHLISAGHWVMIDEPEAVARIMLSSV
jgi:pimeloyl-ACP methyl ester carboxylesterase